MQKATPQSIIWGTEPEGDSPTSEWKGMPEFVQEKQEPYAKITVRFDNEEALQEFAKLIGQKLTNKTQSIWHPELIRGAKLKEFWVDPNEE